MMYCQFRMFCLIVSILRSIRMLNHIKLTFLGNEMDEQLANDVNENLFSNGKKGNAKLDTRLTVIFCLQLFTSGFFSHNSHSK